MPRAAQLPTARRLNVTTFLLNMLTLVVNVITLCPVLTSPPACAAQTAFTLLWPPPGGSKTC